MDVAEHRGSCLDYICPRCKPRVYFEKATTVQPMVGQRRMNQDQLGGVQQRTRFNDGLQSQQSDRPFQPHHMAASGSSMYQPQPCLVYQKGHCRFGNQCAHLHELPEIDVTMSVAEYQEWQQEKLMGRIHSLETIIPNSTSVSLPTLPNQPIQMGVSINEKANLGESQSLNVETIAPHVSVPTMPNQHFQMGVLGNAGGNHWERRTRRGKRSQAKNQRNKEIMVAKRISY